MFYEFTFREQGGSAQKDQRFLEGSDNFTGLPIADFELLSSVSQKAMFPVTHFHICVLVADFVALSSPTDGNVATY